MSVVNDKFAWIEKADHDLGSAKIIFINIPEYFDTISFHCQQAVEKYLKALLIHLEIEFTRTHDLVYLLEILSNHIEISENQFKDAFVLNNYSVQVRYPNEIIPLTHDEIKKAITIAENFRCFVTERII
jgi:HEPN domain-containing protein